MFLLSTVAQGFPLCHFIKVQTNWETLPQRGRFSSRYFSKLLLKTAMFTAKSGRTSGILLPASSRHTQMDTENICDPSVPVDIPPSQHWEQRALGPCPAQEKAASETQPNRWWEGRSINTPRLIRKAKKEKRSQKPNPKNYKMLVWFIYYLLWKHTEEDEHFGFRLQQVDAKSETFRRVCTKDIMLWNLISHFILHIFSTISYLS